jgi:hypothetical protein
MTTRRLVYITIAILAFTLNCFYVANLHLTIKYLQAEKTCPEKTLTSVYNGQAEPFIVKK